MLVRRSLPSLALAAIVAGSAVIALGMPDFALASQYLAGGYPSEQATLAVAAVICWVIVIVFVAVMAFNAVRVANPSQITLRRWPRAIMLAVAGIIVLTMGTLRHTANGYSMCCGDTQQRITEAQTLANTR